MRDPPDQPPPRPRLLSESERRRLLLDAAATVFLERGYAATTMDAIAIAAGMSKKTLYRMHEGKVALFDALLSDRLFRIEPPDLTPHSSQPEQLAQLLLTLGRALLQPERIALLRLLVIEPGEASAVFERIRADRDFDMLERWFAAEARAGRVPPDEAETQGRLAFGLTLAEPMLAALVGKRSCAGDVGSGEFEHHVQRGAAIFLHGLHAEHRLPGP